jgi:hypothetical protein
MAGHIEGFFMSTVSLVNVFCWALAAFWLWPDAGEESQHGELRFSEQSHADDCIIGGYDN